MSVLLRLTSGNKMDFLQYIIFLLFLQTSDPPSSPTGLSSSSIQSTSITLTWNQPTGDIVDSYIITYSFTIRVCGVTGGSTVMVGGSSREYTLTDLEENSDYTISITARNEAGDSPPTTTIMAATSRAGNYYIIYRVGDC